LTGLCLKCGAPAQDRFRLVLGQGRMERLCAGCGDALSALVRAAGDTCQLSLANERFVTWLESGRWVTKDGRTIGSHDLPEGWHGEECPCCATFAEENS
jgi:hypothetical protein